SRLGIAIALVTIAHRAAADQPLTRASRPLLPLGGPPAVTTPAFDRAKESLALSRLVKPSDPDAKVVTHPTALGLGFGAAGLSIAGLLLVTRLGAKRESRKPEA